jgi:uncharacterized membrane protein
MTVLVLALGIGFVTGLRSMVGLAAIVWSVRLGRMSLEGTPLDFLGGTTAVVVLTIGAVFELVNDKLAWTPPRTRLPSLVFRLVVGGLAAAAIAAAGGQSLGLGAAFGAIGAAAGTFGGYEARRRTVSAGLPDLGVALVEDAVAVLAALLVVFCA